MWVTQTPHRSHLKIFRVRASNTCPFFMSTVRLSQVLLHRQVSLKITDFSQWGPSKIFRLVSNPLRLKNLFCFVILDFPLWLMLLKQRIWQPSKHVSSVTHRHTSSHITEGDNLQSVEILQEQVANQKQQINVKDNQIERLQSALNQSQQLQALTESRYQAEQQQLAEMLSRFGSATPTSSVCGWLTVVIT